MDNNMHGVTKEFSLPAVLTVTTGRWFAVNEHYDSFHELLYHMTGERPYTHQLPRFCNECKPWLLRWYPELKRVNNHLGQLDRCIKESGEYGLDVWLLKMENLLKRNTFAVTPIPSEDHQVLNPLTELEGMVGKDKIIVVVADE